MPGIADLVAAAKGGEPAEEVALGADVAEKPAKAAPAKEEPTELGLEGEGEAPATQVPLRHLKAERAKRQAAEQERETLRAEAAAAKERAKILDELYGKFEKPHDQVREDAEFAQAVHELRDDPIVKQALARINQHYHGAKKVTERVEKPAEAAAPAADPMVAELYAERVKDRAESVLTEAKVRPELHGPILAYVLEQKGLKPSKEAVLAAMNEYVTAQGWTRQFLRGGGEKKPLPLPNPGGLNAGTPSKDKPATEKPKNLSQLQEQNRNKFRELMSQRMPQ